MGEDVSVLRDEIHGVHELHLGSNTYEIDFPGLATLYRTWRAALPAGKRTDW